MDLNTATSVLINESKPIAERMNAVFALKSLNNEKAIESLNSGFSSTSNLLTHEIAYVMGQMQNKYAIPFLNNILRNTENDSITRHEAGEALAAIGDPASILILSKFVNDEKVNVSETCILGMDTLKFKESNQWKQSTRFDSMDPAPPNGCSNVEKLSADLLNKKLSLFDRYSALFQLREIGTRRAVSGITKGFCDESSLFKHEIAYVLGQLQDESALESLEKVLRDENEHSMVRHEVFLRSY
ncbi:hypothetical protein MHBO_001324 [Bonamia ostreae]|uniref:Deoxyhypusine monooxygenase n=1 Tax=Bonamia ostreae TaxID=126728 RepID=A0ABV2AIK4_9EUKA